MNGANTGFRTFRDPAGSLHIEGDRILRTVRPQFAVATQAFLNSALARKLTRCGSLISTQFLAQDPDGSIVLEHPRIFFPSYPWEWCPAQWIAAAELTLDLCDSLLDEGLLLKDATPLNILFDGFRPVLVDVLSIEERASADPIWNAYAQFLRTFVLPLMAHRYLGWPLRASSALRDGCEPGSIYPHLPFRRRWFGPAFSFITLPVLLDHFGKNQKALPRIRLSAEGATGVLRSRLRGLKKTLHGLAQPVRESEWSSYTDHREHYPDTDRARKEAFVLRVLKRLRPATVLDIGANSGEFSRMAATMGARVVALDSDAASTAINFGLAKQTGLPILPLNANLARPTPAEGWRNQESLSLLDRCRNRFQCVFMLGLMHHLLVTDQIPLQQIAELVRDLGPRWLVVEWIPPSDAKFIEICRGRDALYNCLGEDALHHAFAPWFRTIEREALDNARVLLLLEMK